MGPETKEKLDTIIGVVVLLNSLTMVMELECEGAMGSSKKWRIQPRGMERFDGTNWWDWGLSNKKSWCTDVKWLLLNTAHDVWIFLCQNKHPYISYGAGSRKWPKWLGCLHEISGNMGHWATLCHHRLWVGVPRFHMVQLAHFLVDFAMKHADFPYFVYQRVFRIQQA